MIVERVVEGLAGETQRYHIGGWQESHGNCEELGWEVQEPFGENWWVVGWIFRRCGCGAWCEGRGDEGTAEDLALLVDVLGVLEDGGDFVGGDERAGGGGEEGCYVVLGSEGHGVAVVQRRSVEGSIRSLCGWRISRSLLDVCCFVCDLLFATSSAGAHILRHFVKLLLRWYAIVQL